MLILASLSGIQDFLFDVRESGGKQAKSLRNRSFRIQLITECVALRLLEAAGWAHDEHLLFSAAGKVCISAERLSAGAVDAMNKSAADIERRLLEETHGRLRLSLAVEQTERSFAEQFDRANRTLAENKLRPFAPVGGGRRGTWANDSLVVRAVWDADAEADRDARVGRDLVNARWLTIRPADGSTPSRAMPDPSRDREGAGSAELNTLDYRVRLEANEPTQSGGLVSCSNLADPESAPRSIDRRLFHPRRLARHIPRDERDNPIEFERLAERSRGAPMLGVLKADVDSLGTAVARTLRRAGAAAGATSLRTLSEALDCFFAETLENEKRRSERGRDSSDPSRDREGAGPQWDLIYTVFSGGDDMLAVGPWDVMLDFAAHMRKLFNERFGPHAAKRPSTDPLTISAGVAVIKPKYPIHLAAQQAEELLEQAKSESAPRANQPKDQCAALGGLWKWEHHDAISGAGKKLAGWVDSRVIQRGWLHTVLELALLRRGQAGPEYAGVHPATSASRLAYHVARNWPKPGRREDPPPPARQWIDAVLREFDQFNTTTHVETIHLQAIVRYAILATRPGTSEDRA